MKRRQEAVPMTKKQARKLFEAGVVFAIKHAAAVGTIEPQKVAFKIAFNLAVKKSLKLLNPKPKKSKAHFMGTFKDVPPIALPALPNTEDDLPF